MDKDQTRRLVILAYEAATMTSPTEEIVWMLSHVGIERALEILLVMRQSPKPVKNPTGFIRKAIEEGWTPTTLPIKKSRNIARIPASPSSSQSIKPNKQVPFYNWLED